MNSWWLVTVFPTFMNICFGLFKKYIFKKGLADQATAVDRGKPDRPALARSQSLCLKER